MNQGDRVVYECEVCQDRGGFIKKVTEQLYPYPVDQWFDCACVERKRINRLFKSSDITEHMQQQTFSKFRLAGRPACVVDAYETAKEYQAVFKEIRKDRNNSIALLGEPGSGKTHLLMAVSNALIADGIPVLYFPFVEGMNELKSLLGEKDKHLYQEKEHQMQRVPVLFLDDLFKSKKGSEPTDYETKFMFSVINYRYLNHLPVIISSELTVNELLFWDHAIGSRIAEMTARFQVLLKGGQDLNYRLPKPL